jgi:hypothetical protein
LIASTRDRLLCWPCPAPGWSPKEGWLRATKGFDVGERTFRSLGWNSFGGLFVSATALLALILAIGSPTLVLHVAFAVFVPPLAWIAVRVFRARLVVTTDGITVYDWARTTRIPWPEVATVAPINARGAFVVAVTTLDGTVVLAHGLASYSVGWQQRVASEVLAARP